MAADRELRPSDLHRLPDEAVQHLRHSTTLLHEQARRSQAVYARAQSTIDRELQRRKSMDPARATRLPCGDGGRNG